ncbi:MAG: hypothetical protein AB9856_04840 [Cellulosilyticaceae bacterium]
MKKQSTRISANEINRFLYCPYQWYYKRTYGNKALQEQYKALNISDSNHESYYTKGLKHHAHYHKIYRLKKILTGIIITLLVVGIIGVIIKWN